jgi:hypothetical protein
MQRNIGARANSRQHSGLLSARTTDFLARQHRLRQPREILHRCDVGEGAGGAGPGRQHETAAGVIAGANAGTFGGDLAEAGRGDGAREGGRAIVDEEIG